MTKNTDNGRQNKAVLTYVNLSKFVSLFNLDVVWSVPAIIIVTKIISQIVVMLTAIVL